jgi:hypothetical protein
MYSWQADGVIENKEATALRQEINKMIAPVCEALIAADAEPVIVYTPPAVAPGPTRRINVIQNFFRLGDFRINRTVVTDFIDIGLGEYERQAVKAIVRTFNPLYWVGVGLEYVASLPFKLLGRAGFNQARIEGSVAGRIVKRLVEIVMFLSALLTALHYLGLLDSLLAPFRNHGS